MQLPRAYQIDQVMNQALVGAAVDIPINDRVFMVSNIGAEPAYIMPESQGAATATTGFIVPSNTVIPHIFSCHGNLSAISTATGTTLSIMFLDV